MTEDRPFQLDDDDRCPSCGDVIPGEDVLAHEQGVDSNRLACAHQDLEKVVAAGRSESIWAKWERASW
jgi:hypothetical protein